MTIGTNFIKSTEMMSLGKTKLRVSSKREHNLTKSLNLSLLVGQFTKVQENLILIVLKSIHHLTFWCLPMCCRSLLRQMDLYLLRVKEELSNQISSLRNKCKMRNANQKTGNPSQMVTQKNSCKKRLMSSRKEWRRNWASLKSQDTWRTYSLACKFKSLGMIFMVRRLASWQFSLFIFSCASKSSLLIQTALFRVNLVSLRETWQSLWWSSSLSLLSRD